MRNPASASACSQKGIPGNNNGVRAIRLFTSKIADWVVVGLNMEGEKVFYDEGQAAAAVVAADETVEVAPVEEVDLEAALGGGIRKADVALAGFDEAEEETGHF
jgi:small subunit ribosomal protein S2